MRIKLMQINLDRDADAIAFMSLETIIRDGKLHALKDALYDVVFDGEVQADDLEEVYRIFNVDKPEGFAGRSLSVSDIVHVMPGGGTRDVTPGYYYCDTIGFKVIFM